MQGEIDPELLENYSDIHGSVVDAYETVESYARDNSYFNFKELVSEVETSEALGRMHAEKIVEFLEETQVIEQLYPETEHREYSGVVFRYSRFDSLVDQLDQ